MVSSVGTLTFSHIELLAASAGEGGTNAAAAAVAAVVDVLAMKLRLSEDEEAHRADDDWIQAPPVERLVVTKPNAVVACRRRTAAESFMVRTLVIYRI